MTAAFGLAARVRSRLRNKLALAMVLTSLAPLIAAGAIAAWLVVGRLERGLGDQAVETAKIAVNLLLRQAESAARETKQLAASAELHEMLSEAPGRVPRFLRREARRMSAGMVEISDGRGKILGRASPSPARYRPVRSTRESAALGRALGFRRYLSIERVDGRLVIQAAAPAVDATFKLRGAVVNTVLLDDRLAETLKGVLRAEVAIVVAGQPVASTFRSEGAALGGLTFPRAPRRRAGRGLAHHVREIGGDAYTLASAPLQNAGGKRLGHVVVALDRRAVELAQAAATRALSFGSAVALVIALLVAAWLGQRITTPLSRLHRRIRALAAGDLEQTISVETSDEIGNLARAFQQMTTALREHQERLAARIRELSFLHRVGRTVSSVLRVDEVLRLVVVELADVLDAEQGAILTEAGDGTVKLRAGVGLSAEEGPPALPHHWVELTRKVLDDKEISVDLRVLVAPLETREGVFGVLLLSRADEAAPFLAAEVRLVETFADQAATAINNAELYAEVRTFSEGLEREVERRTAELRNALRELQETQAQLVLSDRLAGLGSVVAGVAHEINTPAGAIQGAGAVLAKALDRSLGRLAELMGTELAAEEARRVFEAIAAVSATTERRLLPPAEVRRQARELATVLEGAGVADARRLTRRLVACGAGDLAQLVAELSSRVEPSLLVGLIEDLHYLCKNVDSIQTANAQVVRIVRALRSYAHADQEAVREVDLVEGLETTLTILHNELQCGINVERNYSSIPRVSVYVDELNQVWTNLIHNAVQAIGDKGTITIETFEDGDEVGVRISDDGPGIPPEVLPRIFDPFFSTKPRGQGTGLGLGIARKIVEKHGGQMAVESRTGRTVFTVLLPKAGPTGAPGQGGSEGEV